MTARRDLPPSARLLAAFRAERDYSLAELAWKLRELSREVDRIDAGPTAKTVWRWEQGARPAARYRRLLCRLYDASPDRLGFRDAPPHAAPAPPARALRPSPTHADACAELNRRDLLRLFSVGGALLTLDAERLGHAAGGSGRVDRATLDELSELNGHLWRVFALSTSKGDAMPLVRAQLDVLATSLQRQHGAATRRRLCTLIADLYQLAGEILFDGDRYTDAAFAYTLAAAASREADAFDLWACALIRHAFIALYERQFAQAAPVLEAAAKLARRGDRRLSTWHWAHAVSAEVLAGLSDAPACAQALNRAEEVHSLGSEVHTGGWLRFDGSRLAETRGACYVELGRRELAEAELHEANDVRISARRRACVLTDLASLAAQRGDVDGLVENGRAALELARLTESGWVARKLRSGLRPRLDPLLDDQLVHRLGGEIDALVGSPAAG